MYASHCILSIYLMSSILHSLPWLLPTNKSDLCGVKSVAAVLRVLNRQHFQMGQNKQDTTHLYNCVCFFFHV